MKSVNDAAYARFLTRLRAARIDIGMSQEELARRLQKHQTYVSKVENGDRFLDLMEYLRWAREIKADALLLLEPLADEIYSRPRAIVRRRLKREV